MIDINSLIQKVVDIEIEKILGKIDEEIITINTELGEPNRRNGKSVRYGNGLGLLKAKEIIQTEKKEPPIYIGIDLAYQEKTKGDVIRESNESLAKYIADNITSCGCEAYEICNNSGADCTDVWIKYFNQKAEEE